MLAGLGNLSAPLQAIADFLDIDEDLIAVAAAASPSIQEPDGLAECAASLPAEEKDALLARVAAGESAQVQALLLRRFRAASGSSPAAPARTAAELLEAAADRNDARVKAAEQRGREEEARRTAARAAAYAKHLDQLATPHGGGLGEGRGADRDQAAARLRPGRVPTERSAGPR